MKKFLTMVVACAVIAIVGDFTYIAYEASVTAVHKVKKVVAKIEHVGEAVEGAKGRIESYFRQASTGMLPDRTKTPGAVRNVSVDELCHTSTKLVRNVPSSLKTKVLREYGMQSARELWCDTSSGCEIDHETPLELGGSNSLLNLWPQPYEGAWNAHMKDKLENRLHEMVCSGSITLTDAQKAIQTNWIEAYKTYVK